MRFADFLTGDHRRTHKWYQYFPVYERHCERFRNRHVTLFEIGIAEGGSMQLWRRHLGPFVRIVGIDVNPICKQLEEDQIQVRIGSQDNLEFLAQVLLEFGSPDIVIDDGSHLQGHVNATFDFLYPHVAKNGVYVIEDLHAAYWPDHGAGLRHPASFIERAKGYIDEMHAHYTGGELPPSALGQRTTSIHFYDSIVVLEVGEFRVAQQAMTGDASRFRADWRPGDGAPEREPPAQCEPPPQPAAAAIEPEAAQALQPEMQDLQREMQELRSRLDHLERENAALRGSTSWRVTEPFRQVGKLLRS
ncbi:MAG: hypothetical protein JO047_05310 [Alphaproteobacteria bacterium]|nr:hypothetical protein [Alphaproteobacteria bacterium]